MARNSDLCKAKVSDNDEFYTRYCDIKNELENYSESEFSGRTIYCNCDDWTKSQFFQYFMDNFWVLGLKKLICTSYNSEGCGTFCIYDGHVESGELAGNGDFRSDECIEYLKECDMVVTNPPFSLFRQFIAVLMKYGKKFIIIGNGNAATYRDIFPYIRSGEIWIGCKGFAGGMNMYPGPNYDVTKCKHPRYDDSGKLMVNVMMCVWFTNVENSRRNTPIELKEKYSEEKYRKYDNCDAIEVKSVSEIPYDYDGLMGVPVTFLAKHCPKQFEIVGYEHDIDGNGTCLIQFLIDGKGIYKRLLIKKVIKQ